MDFKNISLIGFMGSGKSTVGEILAGKLSYNTSNRNKRTKGDSLFKFPFFY
ncbi:unnamed protein product [marine sediment metagenome]|uniref:Uncharacterized protein n=1 Tax=marine sediment metagenome TaxID=412755 RepID=X0YPU5_9ZZZZ